MARNLSAELTLAAIAGDGVPDPAKLNKMWLKRWKLEWGVCLRKPTKKYKVSRPVIKERLLVFLVAFAGCEVFVRPGFPNRTYTGAVRPERGSL